jgi:hypothetical protein
VFPVIVVNRHYVQYSRKLHIPQANQKTKRHTYLPLSRDSKIFAHLEAAPGRRLVGEEGSNSMKHEITVFTAGMITNCR